MGVNPEMDRDDAQSPNEEGETGTIVMDGSQVAAMRRLMHELSNVLTGVMISGGLLEQYLHPSRPTTSSPGAAEAGGPNLSGIGRLGTKALWHYAAGVCEGCERGCALLRELRGQLLAACGEAEAGALGTSSGKRESNNVESF